METPMKTATAKDLRQKTATLLEEVRRGRTVIITYRGKTVAALTPIKRAARKDLIPGGFGMWKDRKEMKSVERWLANLRKPRHTQ